MWRVAGSEWSGLQYSFYVEKLGRQFVGWELCAVRSGVSAGEHDRRTDGQVQHALHSVGVVGRFRAGGWVGDTVKLT